MTGNYMEFREIVKKYEFDKMFEDNNTLQVYRDIMLNTIYTAIKDISDIDSSYDVNDTSLKIDIICNMLSEIHHTIPSDAIKEIASEIKFRIGNNIYYDSGNCMTLFAAIINIILA